QVIVGVGGGDGHDIRQVVAGRIERVLVVVLADAEEVAVARGGDIDVPGIGRVQDRVVQGLGIRVAAVAVVGNLRAVGDGVIQSENGVAGRAAAAGVEELDGHDLHVPVDAGDADAVIAHGADGAGHV